MKLPCLRLVDYEKKSNFGGKIFNKKASRGKK